MASEVTLVQVPQREIEIGQAPDLSRGIQIGVANIVPSLLAGIGLAAAFGLNAANYPDAARPSALLGLGMCVVFIYVSVEAGRTGNVKNVQKVAWISGVLLGVLMSLAGLQ